MKRAFSLILILVLILCPAGSCFSEEAARAYTGVNAAFDMNLMGQRAGFTMRTRVDEDGCLQYLYDFVGEGMPFAQLFLQIGAEALVVKADTDEYREFRYEDLPEFMRTLAYEVLSRTMNDPGMAKYIAFDLESDIDALIPLIQPELPDIAACLMAGGVMKVADEGVYLKGTVGDFIAAFAVYLRSLAIDEELLAELSQLKILPYVGIRTDDTAGALSRALKRAAQSLFVMEYPYDSQIEIYLGNDGAITAEAALAVSARETVGFALEYENAVLAAEASYRYQIGTDELSELTFDLDADLNAGKADAEIAYVLRDAQLSCALSAGDGVMDFTIDAHGPDEENESLSGDLTIDFNEGTMDADAHFKDLSGGEGSSWAFEAECKGGALNAGFERSEVLLYTDYAQKIATAINLTCENGAFALSGSRADVKAGADMLETDEVEYDLRYADQALTGFISDGSERIDGALTCAREGDTLTCALKVDGMAKPVESEDPEALIPITVMEGLLTLNCQTGEHALSYARHSNAEARSRFFENPDDIELSSAYADHKWAYSDARYEGGNPENVYAYHTLTMDVLPREDGANFVLAGDINGQIITGEGALDTIKEDTETGVKGVLRAYGEIAAPNAYTGETESTGMELTLEYGYDAGADMDAYHIDSVMSVLQNGLKTEILKYSMQYEFLKNEPLVKHVTGSAVTPKMLIQFLDEIADA